jgi:hypothetical protein
MPHVISNDLHEFISKRCPDLSCPACGGKQLQPEAETKGQPIALLYEDSSVRSWFGPPTYLRVFALSCSSCDYVMLFKLDLFEQRTRGRSSKGSTALG